MKAVFACFAVAILTLSLSACATTADSTLASNSDDSKYDTEYMAKVEHASRGRGVHVTWINPPEKRKKSGDKQDND